MFILVSISFEHNYKPKLTIMQTKISDLVQISPADLKKPSAQAIEDNINAKYANKVNLGILESEVRPLLIRLIGNSKDWFMCLSLRPLVGF